MKAIITSVLIFSIAMLGSLKGQVDSSKATEASNTTRVVLTEEDFKMHNCENVGDALNIITGVYINSQGDVALRDVSASKVVVIMDGQKLNVPGSVGVKVSTISINKVAMIELLRGGRSAEYGADAVGGVIRITTKSKSESEPDMKSWSLGAKGSLGSFGRQIFTLNTSNTLNKFDYMLSYRIDGWDGDYDFMQNPYTDLDGLIAYGTDDRITHTNNHESTQSAFGKIGLSLPADQKLQMSVSSYIADNGTPGLSYNLTPDARLRFDTNSYNLNYNKSEIFKGFSLKAQALYLTVRTRFDDPTGSTVEIHSDHKNYAKGLDISQAGKIGDKLDLSYGYSFRNDEINSSEVGDKTRITKSAFLTSSISGALQGFLSQWEAVLALRYDDPSDFASEISPRLSLSTGHQGDVNADVTTHITRSYRAPSFNDLYWPRDAYSIGNPDLKSEYGLNYDLGLNVSVPVSGMNLSTSVNYFRNDVDDLILWAQTAEGGQLWTPSNLSKTSTTGVETSANISMMEDKLLLNVEYTYMKALNKSEGTLMDKYIIYRPKNKLGVTGTLRVKAIDFNVIYNWVGLRYDRPANTVWLPAYSLLDANLNYRYSLSGFSGSVTLEATNLLDVDYWRTKGNSTPGRMVKLSLGINL